MLGNAEWSRQIFITIALLISKNDPEEDHTSGRKMLVTKVKVKQSHYRPEQALRVPRVWGSQILRQMAHAGGKVVSPTHRPPLPQEIFLVLLSVRGWVDPRAIVRIMSMKNFNAIGNRSRDLPVCSAVPQPLRHRVPPDDESTSTKLKCNGWSLIQYTHVIHATNEEHIQLVKSKEPTRCDKVCSFIASTCFGHQYAGVQSVTSAFRWPYLESRLGVALGC
jgi:hypothetical protein